MNGFFKNLATYKKNVASATMQVNHHEIFLEIRHDYKCLLMSKILMPETSAIGNGIFRTIERDFLSTQSPIHVIVSLTACLAKYLNKT